MTTLAAEFLNYLEKCISLGEDLPVPYLMHRIKTLLDKQLATGTSDTWDETPGPGAFPPTPEERYTDNYDSQPQVLDRFQTALDSITALHDSIYVDVQCHITSEGYAIREFSIACRGSDIGWVTLKPPAGTCQNTKDNMFMTRNIHGIPWDAGIIDEDCLRRMTSPVFIKKRNVFVKGIQKVKILQRKLNIRPQYIIDVDCEERLKTLVGKYEPCPCPMHQAMDQDFICARKNVEAIMRYCTNK